MIVIARKPITTEERQEIAEWFARTINIGYPDFEPYKPNEQDDSFWTIDVANDFKIKFSNTRLEEVDIRHRYFNKDATEGLALWFAYRWGGKVLNNTGDKDGNDNTENSAGVQLDRISRRCT